VATRALDGSIAVYPVVENVHAQGILVRSIAPARLSDVLARAAEEHARRVIEALDHVGTLALELFVADGTLIANEIAPRVHNSGHWTMSGTRTSQFENHMRAVAGLPLGECSSREPAAMVNLIGGVPETAEILRIPGANVHLYHKAPRAGRKVGHITLVAPTMDELLNRCAMAQALAQRSNRLS
jgi:5-(carboxyamino)imidazole ribonucleotide synthase